MRQFALLLAATAMTALAQMPARIVSPEVSDDHKVTFRLKMPNAQDVKVSVEGSKPVAMTKDESGVWTATVGPLDPDYYGYTFNVDGTSMTDPSNTTIKPNYIYASSMFHVPGEQPWETTNVPHGMLHRHFYHSGVVGDDRDFYVYTPPDYATSGNKKYPVLYLLHGFSDDASGWTSVGRANYMLDNLIAQGKAKPMLIVMTLGYGAPEVLKPSPRMDRTVFQKNMERYTESLLTEVIPQVEKMYRANPNREARAIAGLSMGGAESLLTGLNHIDKFAYVGAFSSGGFTNDYAAQWPNLDAKANDKLKLLWIACGTEDGLIKANRGFKDWLTSKGVKFESIETPGAHTWLVWRRNLATFTPLLFQGKSL